MTSTIHDSETLLIRRATLDDWPKIWEFLKDSYGELVQFKDKSRWDWQFVENPYARNESDELPDSVWIALANDNVVGQIAIQKGELLISGTAHPAGWIVDVMVLPSHRGRKLGHEIHARCASSESILVTLTMAPATRRIAEKAGCITLRPVRQFSRWQRLDAESVRLYLLSRTMHRPKWYKLANFLTRFLHLHMVLPLLINPLLTARDKLKVGTPRRDQDVVVQEKNVIDDEFDDLWEQNKGDYEVLFSRDSKFLSWRFKQCPVLDYRIFVARRDGKPTGYVVLRRAQEKELSQGFIVDLFAPRRDSETIDSLIEFSIRYFGHAVAEVNCATSIPEIDAALRKRGFYVTRTMRPTCVCSDPMLRDTLESSEWFLTKADHDWDQIHLVSHFSNT